MEVAKEGFKIKHYIPYYSLELDAPLPPTGAHNYSPAITMEADVGTKVTLHVYLVHVHVYTCRGLRWVQRSHYMYT